MPGGGGADGIRPGTRRPAAVIACTPHRPRRTADRGWVTVRQQLRQQRRGALRVARSAHRAARRRGGRVEGHHLVGLEGVAWIRSSQASQGRIGHRSSTRRMASSPSPTRPVAPAPGASRGSTTWSFVGRNRPAPCHGLAAPSVTSVVLAASALDSGSNRIASPQQPGHALQRIRARQPPHGEAAPAAGGASRGPTVHAMPIQAARAGAGPCRRPRRRRSPRAAGTPGYQRRPRVATDGSAACQAPGAASTEQRNRNPRRSGGRGSHHLDGRELGRAPASDRQLAPTGARSEGQPQGRPALRVPHQRRQAWTTRSSRLRANSPASATVKARSIRPASLAPGRAGAPGAMPPDARSPGPGPRAWAARVANARPRHGTRVLAQMPIVQHDRSRRDLRSLQAVDDPRPGTPGRRPVHLGHQGPAIRATAHPPAQAQPGAPRPRGPGRRRLDLHPGPRPDSGKAPASWAMPWSCQKPPQAPATAPAAVGPHARRQTRGEPRPGHSARTGAGTWIFDRRTAMRRLCGNASLPPVSFRSTSCRRRYRPTAGHGGIRSGWRPAMAQAVAHQPVLHRAFNPGKARRDYPRFSSSRSSAAAPAAVMSCR